MTAPPAFRVVASVHYTWGGGTEYWEFELPVDGVAGRMRSASEGDWRPWQELDDEQTESLASLCRDALRQPDPGPERPTLAIDGSMMELRLRAPGDEAVLEDRIVLGSWTSPHGEPPASPLLRLVARIFEGTWPDRAPVRRTGLPVTTAYFRPPDPRFANMAPPQWPGRSETGSLVLPLREARKGPRPEQRLLDGLAIVPKKELHLTLLSSGEANELAAHLPTLAWRDAFEAMDWTLDPSGKAVLLFENKAEGLDYSVVTPVDCPALNTFRQRLCEASGAFLLPTVPHVTLWTRPKGRGIGIRSTAQYQEFFVRELAPEEAASFLEGTVFARGPTTDTL